MLCKSKHGKNEIFTVLPPPALTVKMILRILCSHFFPKGALISYSLEIIDLLIHTFSV